MSIPSSVLKALANAGCSADQIVSAVEAAEQEAEEKLAKKREQNRIRQQNHRARNAASRVTSVTERDEALPPVSDKEKSPTPPKEINSTPKTSLRSVETNRATRLPNDWKLPATWGQWALAEGYSEATIRLEAEKFGDFWQSKAGQDAKKTDWQKTYRNWMRNVPKSIASRSPPRNSTMERQEAALRAFTGQSGFDDDDEFAGNTIDLRATDIYAH